jgi:hypothetical protein
MAAIRASDTITAMPKNVLFSHKEAFCVQRRKPYSIAGDASLAILLTLDWPQPAAEF